MTVYTFSEARQKFAALLERARREGAVRVKRRDGQVFLIQPERRRGSPFDIKGIATDVSAREIVEVVREMREQTTFGRLVGPRSRPRREPPARTKR